ncbi:MAG: DUF6788 family protein [Egibacteraceae bacterium]
MAQPDESPRQAQARIAEASAQIGFALPGSLVTRRTACGKAGCRCHADPPLLHGPYLSWTRTVAGKTVTRKLTPDQQRRRLVAQLEALSVAALKDAEGWQQQSPTRP